MLGQSYKQQLYYPKTEDPLFLVMCGFLIFYTCTYTWSIYLMWWEKISSKLRTFFLAFCVYFSYIIILCFLFFSYKVGINSQAICYNYEEFVIKFKSKLTLTTTSLNMHYWSRSLLMYRFSNSSPEIGNFSQFVKEELHRKE